MSLDRAEINRTVSLCVLGKARYTTVECAELLADFSREHVLQALNVFRVLVRNEAVLRCCWILAGFQLYRITSVALFVMQSPRRVCEKHRRDRCYVVELHRNLVSHRVYKRLSVEY
jgi:hypothetical protein